jgi:hypothetical protein
MKPIHRIKNFLTLKWLLNSLSYFIVTILLSGLCKPLFWRMIFIGWGRGHWGCVYGTKRAVAQKSLGTTGLDKRTISVSTVCTLNAGFKCDPWCQILVYHCYCQRYDRQNARFRFVRPEQVMTMTGLHQVVRFLSNDEFNNLCNLFPNRRNYPCPWQYSDKIAELGSAHDDYSTTGNTVRG